MLKVSYINSETVILAKIIIKFLIYLLFFPKENIEKYGRPLLCTFLLKIPQLIKEILIKQQLTI